MRCAAAASGSEVAAMEIIVHGATGHMGRAVLKLLGETEDCTLAAAVSPELTTDPTRREFETLDAYQGPADLIIDFSFHTATHALMAYALARKLPVIVCTTGQTEAEKAEQAKLRREYIDSVVGNLRTQLEHTYIKKENGEIVSLSARSEDDSDTE